MTLTDLYVGGTRFTHSQPESTLNHVSNSTKDSRILKPHNHYKYTKHNI